LLFRKTGIANFLISMDGFPFFSIIIPTYNRADFIGATINSLLDQVFPDFEIIIVDDGSTDNTAEKISTFQDPRIRYFIKENEERAAARNYGIDRSEGKYITFIDSDDIAYPNHLSEARKLIELHGNPELLHLGYEMRDLKGKLIKSFNQRSGVLAEAILKGNLLSCIGVFVRKEIITRHRFFEARELAGTEDWLLWLRLSARYNWIYSNRITSCMINHDSRSVLSFREKDLVSRTEILIRELGSDPVFLQKFGKKAISRIGAHMASYTALHLILSARKKQALKYLLKTLTLYPAEFFKRRTLAIIKHLVL
jgi:glycosyltransferase involved in cell wall biosynthesis